MFTDKEKVALLTKADLESLMTDPAFELQSAFAEWFAEDIRPVVNDLNAAIRLANRDYMRGQMAFEPNKAFYPDANLTLRVAYGHVAGYHPADGMYYSPVSTLKGIIEKDNPEIFD